jgi:flagellar basal body-associated protein FliL
MVKRFLAAALAATLLLVLPAGCGREEKPEAFPGENDITFSLGEKFTIDSTGTSDDTRRYKWVVCDVMLEVGDAAIIKIFEVRLHRIREIVTDSIRARTLDELRTAGDKEVLRQEIMDKVNEEFNTTSVRRVIFSEFYFA